jgi:hypothetical protein
LPDLGYDASQQILPIKACPSRLSVKVMHQCCR